MLHLDPRNVSSVEEVLWVPPDSVEVKSEDGVGMADPEGVDLALAAEMGSGVVEDMHLPPTGEGEWAWVAQREEYLGSLVVEGAGLLGVIGEAEDM